jgi:hypothetical protein
VKFANLTAQIVLHSVKLSGINTQGGANSCVIYDMAWKILQMEEEMAVMLQEITHFLISVFQLV